MYFGRMHTYKYIVMNIRLMPMNTQHIHSFDCLLVLAHSYIHSFMHLRHSHTERSVAFRIIYLTFELQAITCTFNCPVHYASHSKLANTHAKFILLDKILYLYILYVRICTEKLPRRDRQTRREQHTECLI